MGVSCAGEALMRDFSVMLFCSTASLFGCAGDQSQTECGDPDCSSRKVCVERGYFGEECFGDQVCDLEDGPVSSVTVFREESRHMVGDHVFLDSSRCLSAPDAELSYRWYFQSVPEESDTRLEPEVGSAGSPIDSESEAPQPSFLLDVRGHYQVCLQVCDQTGACTSPDSDQECHQDFCIWIASDYLSHIAVRATWDHPDANLDLHYIRSGAMYADLSDGPSGDCHPSNELPGPCSGQEDFRGGNPSPDYCTPGDPLDDPFFSQEDNCGYGPEMLVHDFPCDDTYRLWLSYEEDWGRGSTLARVRLYSGDGPPEEPEHLADLEHELEAKGCHWLVGEITWSEGLASFEASTADNYVCGVDNPEL